MGPSIASGPPDAEEDERGLPRRKAATTIDTATAHVEVSRLRPQVEVPLPVKIVYPKTSYVGRLCHRADVKTLLLAS